MKHGSWRDFWVVLCLTSTFAVVGSVAVVSCTPGQRAVVKDVWDIASPIVNCLLSSKYEDEETAMLACGVQAADREAAKQILGYKAAVRKEGELAGQKMGCSVHDAGKR